MSQWISFPVKDMASWKTILEERFTPALEDRLPKDWSQQKAAFVKDSKDRWVTFFCFPLVGMFGPLRELFGFENLIYLMVDSPDLIHTVLDDLTDFWLRSFDGVLRDGVHLDQITFFEDMCSTRSSLIGPSMFRELMSHRYKRVIGELRSMGVSLFSLDTDGNAWPILPDMISAGLNGISPCEVSAAMDAGRLLKAFPTLYLDRGIAKGALAEDLAAIDTEMEVRFQTAWDQSRYTPNLDHLAPPNIPWQNIQHYAKRYLELAHAPL